MVLEPRDLQETLDRMSHASNVDEFLLEMTTGADRLRPGVSIEQFMRAVFKSPVLPIFWLDSNWAIFARTASILKKIARYVTIREVGPERASEGAICKLSLAAFEDLEAPDYMILYASSRGDEFPMTWWEE